MRFAAKLPAPLRERLQAKTRLSEPAIMRKPRYGGEIVSADATQAQHRLGNGVPLDLGVRDRMESAFATDFSHVRVHTDSTAAALSSELGARAFTSSACACGAGKDEKCSCPIRRSAIGPAPAGLRVSSPTDASEREADAIADAVVGMNAPEPGGDIAVPPAASLPTIAPGGLPLPRPTRTWFEARMGHDLSSVRVHTGDAPPDTNRSEAGSS